MIVLAVIFAVVVQVGALLCGYEAMSENDQFTPNKKVRNRWAFACLVLSVAALLTAYRIGVVVAGC